VAFRVENKAKLEAQTTRLGVLTEKVMRVERQLEQIFKPVLPHWEIEN
jgi:hypothetical protein